MAWYRRLRSQRYLVFGVMVVFLMWNILTHYLLATKPQSTSAVLSEGNDVQEKLDRLETAIKAQLEQNEKLLRDLKNYRLQAVNMEQSNDDTKNIDNQPPAIPGGDNSLMANEKRLNPNMVVLPVLMIACNRVTVTQSLDQIFKYRPLGDQFPVIVSQDCGDQATANVIRGYGAQVKLIQHPDLSDIELPWPQKKFKGYYKIARHYKWALNQVFNTLNYTAVIVVEDDLNISPDFFEYFASLYPLLHHDRFLWCVSAWNDNGKEGNVEDDPALLYRTDFFPGLGWMMEKHTWLELEPKWPETFWDDWMRHPDQRNGRQCIRPEISRTTTFGKVGVSKGQFYEKHLKFIKLNDKFVPFTKRDLSYLEKDNYDRYFTRLVYNTTIFTANEVVGGLRPGTTAVRIEYRTKDEFKKITKVLGIMDDLKAGVPRAGYMGIVSFMYSARRVFLAPPFPWSGYNPTWN